jgi:pimeloyl-ACP methyl ester carboxylesterase
MKKTSFFSFVSAMAVSLGACSDAEPVTRKHAGECVVLLHGLARTSLSMERMKWFLEESGYQVANIDYPSRDFEIDKLAPLAVEDGLARCAEKGNIERIHFVTHSLGGILVRYYFAGHQLGSLGRVVMLAPPNQGSIAVDELKDWPGFEWLNGPAGYQLGKGENSVPLQLGPPKFEFAVIAGDESIDPVTSAVLEDPDDGRVSVSDTYLEGMKDFRLVGASHAFIMQKSDVLELVRSFLETGQFPGTEEGADDAG